MKIAWHAIVKNEEAIIARCVKSILPHVDCGIVVDTGSSDYTIGRITRLFMEADKPVEVHSIPFENFAQARNDALRLARASSLDYSHLLLADADMELVVEKVPWLNGESGLAYDMTQKAGGLSYANRRLLKREATAEYRGVTHEYLDIPSAGVVDGAWFLDHADGANRPDKLVRDVALLEHALDHETNPGLIQRYHFYLANTYYDLGRFEDALIHYQRRVQIGGWDEELWYAQMRLASCYGRLGQCANFLWEMLRAYSLRPKRGEVLYELAKFFRERGENFASLLFSDPGRGLPLPGDALFVADGVYETGLREEFAICAYYDKRRRCEGAKVANKLALAGSQQARANLYWYLKPLSEDVLSFRAKPIGFTPEKGWVAMNPSVVIQGGAPLFLVRTVNYEITPEGRYVIPSAPFDPVVIRTRNFIGSEHQSWDELELPTNWPVEPQFPLVLGFEDSRLFEWRGSLWTLSTVRELTREGWCEQVLAPIHREGGRCSYGNNWRQILPAHRCQEKNWMPWVRGGDLHFVYRLGALVDLHGEIVAQDQPDQAVGHISGGSQVVKIDDRTNLALVHEAGTIPGRSTRYYQHRFVNFTPHGRVDKISAPFFFHDRQIEFCAGMGFLPEQRQLVVTYGVRDCEAMVATMDVDEVLRFIWKDAL